MTQPPGSIPPEVLGAWQQAEARLYQVVLTRPDVYQRAVVLVGRVSAALVAACADVDALLTRAAAEQDGGWPVVGDQAAEAGVPLEGLEVPTLALAGFAMAGRQVVGAAVQARRRARMADAIRDGVPWAVLEERGDPAGTPWAPYLRLEVRPDTGEGVLVTTEPDEDLAGVVHQVRPVGVDRSGAVVEVEPAGEVERGWLPSEHTDSTSREDAASRLKSLIDGHS